MLENETPRSQHPDDRLIRDLLQTRRPATGPEVERIRERMASAPFASRLYRVPVAERGLVYLGVALGNRAAPFDYHLVKRVLVEEQWSRGTTPADYRADLAAAARSLFK
jgi:hypothetical protein